MISAVAIVTKVIYVPKLYYLFQVWLLPSLKDGDAVDGGIHDWSGVGGGKEDCPKGGMKDGSTKYECPGVAGHWWLSKLRLCDGSA